MEIMVGQLKQIMPMAGKRADLFVPYISETLNHFLINTPLRAAAFLAQIAHESGQLRWVKELASGEAYDTGPLAKRLGNTPEDDDDGRRYKGRGLLQVTGRTNYAACSRSLFGDPAYLLDRPEVLESPRLASLSAGWYWHVRGLNAPADLRAFKQITKAINGGYNGLDERLRFYAVALNVLQGGDHG